ncbi:MAG: DUF2314 domain-containing protein [Verrucomicrobia bacterium]|nr:DUF2314 domain-containing protein [Verrucomicrobiota bacterium]
MGLRYFLISTLTGLALFGGAACSKQQEEEPVETPKPPAIDVTRAQPYQTKDAELNAAMQEARNSLPAFVAESMNNESSGTAFTVKVHAVSPAGEEDLWLTGIVQDGDHYTAVVESDPKALAAEFPMGTEVRFSPGEVVEWHYFKDDKVTGAQVTRILRQRMTPAQRAEHDVIYPFPFE